jgi:hypothetical protein
MSMHRPLIFSSRRGSVIVMVLVMVTLASFLLGRFIERSLTELLVESRARHAERLRADAHSALELTLAVLAEYQALDNGLRSPAQGWGDPLAGHDFKSRAGITVEVAIADESGKPSLPRLDAPALATLLQDLGVKEADATRVAAALLAWTRGEHASARFETDPRNYEYEDPPHRPPGRPLGSFHELAAIAVARDLFYTADRRPTELHARFAESVSLYDFPVINLNTVRPQSLALAGLAEDQRTDILDFNRDPARRTAGTPPWFRSVAEAQALLGATVPLAGFDTLVRCLRIQVTVREGAAAFHLIAVVTPVAGGVAVPGATAAPVGDESGLQYPFTLLALEEKIQLAPAPTI